MNKIELIDSIAEKTGLPKTDAAKAVEAMTSTIVEALQAGDTVTIPSFGTFQAKVRAAHQGRNPKTGESMMIAEKNAPSFKAGKGLKDALNG